MSLQRAQVTAWLSLFTSLGTLLCCALPALLVAVGAGAVLAGLVATLPGLVWLSEYKVWTFGASALMLTLGGLVHWLNRNAPCPVDANLAAACASARRTSKRVYLVSLGIFVVGGFFAFIAPELLG